MRHVPTIPLYDARYIRAEVYKTRLRMWIAFWCSVVIAGAVGASVRRQPWIDLPWWVTPVTAIGVLIVCFWLGDRMWHKGWRP
jgi:hypothetical protein